MRLNLLIKMDSLGRDITKLSDSIVETIQNQVAIFAKKVRNQGLDMVDEKYPDYLPFYQRGLKYRSIGDSVHEIYLIEGSLAQLYEEGFSSYPMKADFVGVSDALRKAQGPYGSLTHKAPFPIQPHAKAIAEEHIVDMRSAVKAAIKDETVNKRIERFDKGSKGLTKFGDVTYYDAHSPNIAGLTKITPPNQREGRYFLFKVAKDEKGNWIHPAFYGVHMFRDLERFAEEGLEELIRNLIRR